MSRVKNIGIIAEDETDFDAVRMLVAKITNKQNLKYYRKSGEGSGKLKNKCLSWSNELCTKQCNLLIVVHDLDNANFQELKEDLERRLKDSPINNRYICIPVRELEAWFISDPNGVKRAYNLHLLPRFSGDPESVADPKKTLEREIYRCSKKEIYFITRHNRMLAEHIELDTVKRKCNSFLNFYTFIVAQRYS